MPSPQNVLVIVGCGGMGVAIARRLASGRQLLLADKSNTQLASVVSKLSEDGYSPESCEVDVSERASVNNLAQRAAQMGRIDAIVQTAGVSPITGTAKHLYEVDLLGTANVIAEFFTVASPGTSLVCIASMAAQFAPPNPDLESHMATADLDKLLQHKDIDFTSDSGMAYLISKKGNVVRVQAASRQWGSKGARINTVSPGVISTEMGRKEMEGPSGDRVRAMIANCGAGRIGTADDVAGAVAFLVGPDSSFMTGNDILIDGGVVSASRWLNK